MPNSSFVMSIYQCVSLTAADYHQAREYPSVCPLFFTSTRAFDWTLLRQKAINGTNINGQPSEERESIMKRVAAIGAVMV
jgi:hypothetical protein